MDKPFGLLRQSVDVICEEPQVVTATEVIDEYGSFTNYLIRLCKRTPHTHRDYKGSETPCQAVGKRPDEGSNWQEIPEKRRASGTSLLSVAEQISSHVNRGGNCGYVVPSGVIVFDADSQHSASLLRRACDDAPYQETGRGAHLVCRLPDGFPSPTNTVKLSLPGALQADVRAHGAQIACWPSVHHTGRPYTWLTGLPGSIRELPIVPGAWLACLRDQSGGSGSSRSRAAWRAIIDHTIAEGGRHNALASLAGRWFRSSLDPRDAYTALHAWNQVHCVPALPWEEADQIISDIAAKENARRSNRR